MATAIPASQLSQGKLDTGVLIVGGGPLGLTAAIGLGQRGIDHIVAESGDEQPGDMQDLCAGNIIRGRYPDLAETRIRALGGTTHVWGGHSAPFRPSDFEARPEIGRVGWPIAYDDYLPWVGRVTDFFKIADRWNAGDVEKLPHRYFKLPLQYFDIAAYRLSPIVTTSRNPRDFWTQNRDRVTGRVLTGLTLRELNLSEQGIVNGARFLRKDGSSITVIAKQVILALGGIETARFLMLEQRRQSNTPLAALGQLGLGFMEHPHPHLANVYLFDMLPGAFFGKRQKDGSIARPAFFLKPDIMKAEKLVGVYCRIVKPRKDWSYGSNGIVRCKVIGLTEQLPSKTRFVRLSGRETDRLGDPVIELAHHSDHIEHKSCVRAMELFARDIALSGLGRLEKRMTVPDEEISADDYPWIGVGHHHMGTVRMGKSSADGVVDGNLKVFGTRNLYLATTGVFPTSSMVNPTINGAALAMRLAHHLADGRAT